jgi:peptidoglycan/LPS O-acetylase OafA/YrhL
MEQPVGFTGWHKGYLDSLRGIAVLGVVMVHAGIAAHSGPFLFAVTFTGQRGVQLFLSSARSRCS